MRSAPLFAVLAISLLVVFAAWGEELSVARLLPAPACAPGWAREGKVLFYDRENLFERINGESELYFPYGFQQLASARYADSRNPQTAIEIDIYRMGSLLDAFGMYANYRRQDDADVQVGAEGTASTGQLFFYQDRYLVRLQLSGPGTAARETFLACGRSVARNLPLPAVPPRELAAFAFPAVEGKSVRYIAQSLLGYEFFRRGMVAEASQGADQGQLFLVLEESREDAGKALERYRAYLRASGKEPRLGGTPENPLLEGIDPLYGPVVVEKAGSSLAGAIRFKDAAIARRLVEELRKRAAGS